MKNKYIFSQNLLFFLIIFLYFLPFNAFPQESLNRYYRFPASIGVKYQPLSSLAFVERKASFNEISMCVTVPLTFAPVFQPVVFGGLISADSDEKDDPTILGGSFEEGVTVPDYNEEDVWDHRYLFGGVGINYSHRISKVFEVGTKGFFGLGVSTFKKRVITSGGEWYPVGEMGMLTGIEGSIALNPSYNLSLNISPAIRYSRSFGNLHDFDGLYYGVGFSAHYRFGKDPDAPQQEIHSIQFGEISLPFLFAAMQSYYAKNPIGTVSITNSEKTPINDVQVFFFQAGFMDSPTPAETISTLDAGETVEVPLLASFNREVFSVEGITPLTGEVIVSYSLSGRSAEQRHPVSYDLYDKTSMTWDNNEKVAAFVTPADSALRNYTSFIRQSCKEETIPLYNSSLQFAIQAFHALSEIGILYQIDPVLPFTEVQENTMVVDSISLPRDTLKRITGDCDDLTVLFCSLLETVGIETGFITVPGHIYAVFNTKEEAANYKKIHADRDLTINLEGHLWVPVEITMIGRNSFLEAWRKGAEEWNTYKEEPKKRDFYITRKAQELYRPVGLMETDLGLQYGDPEDIIDAFNKDMNLLISQVVSEYIDAAEERSRPKDWNKLGIVYAQFLRYRRAEESFSKALSINPDYLNARINQGNVFFLMEKYDAALETFLNALSIAQQKNENGNTLLTKLLLNISKTYYQTTEYEKAAQYFTLAEEADSDAVKKYSYLAAASGSGGESRASENRDIRYEILFIEEEEQ